MFQDVETTMLGYSRAILEAITEALDAMEIFYVTDDDDGVCFIDLHNAEPMLRSLNLEITALSESFIIRANASATADVNDFELVNSLMEFLCRVNLGLPYGSFQFDCESGAVFYRSVVDCAGLDYPTAEMVKHALVAAVGAWCAVAQGLGGVLYGGLSAKEGFERCDF